MFSQTDNFVKGYPSSSDLQKLNSLNIWSPVSVFYFLSFLFTALSFLNIRVLGINSVKPKLHCASLVLSSKTKLIKSNKMAKWLSYKFLRNHLITDLHWNKKKIFTCNYQSEYWSKIGSTILWLTRQWNIQENDKHINNYLFFSKHFPLFQE